MQAVCYQDLLFLDILTLEDGTDWLSQNIAQWNYHGMLRVIQEKSRHQNIFSISVSFHQENAKWSNVNVVFDIISQNNVH